MTDSSRLMTGSLDSRFFNDDGLWKGAPLLTGRSSFEPLPDVKNIMVTGGEGFMFVSPTRDPRNNGVRADSAG